MSVLVNLLSPSLLLLFCHSGSTQSCPPGFNSTLGRCLLINLTASVTWCDANRACADLGAELITNRTALRAVAATNTRDLWIGVSDMASERNVDKEGWQLGNGRGVLLNSTSMWKTGDPNNGGGIQDCVMLNVDVSPNRSAMIDKACDATAGFVCELPDVPPSATCGGSSSGGVGGGRIRWTPAGPPPSPTTGVPNAPNQYCYSEKSEVLSLRDCAMLAGLRTSSRSFLYNKDLKKCHVTEFSDSQTLLEQTPTAWVKYVKG